MTILCRYQGEYDTKGVVHIKQTKSNNTLSFSFLKTENYCFDPSECCSACFLIGLCSHTCWVMGVLVKGRGESKRPNNQTQQSIKPTLVYLHQPTTLSDEHYKDQHAVLQFQAFGFQISRISFIPTPSVLKSLLKSEAPPPPTGNINQALIRFSEWTLK